MNALLRLYEPDHVLPDGYPGAWHHPSISVEGGRERFVPIKMYVRELAGHRCERCGHPYPPGIAEAHPRGEWTPCDDRCTHEGPVTEWDYLGPDRNDAESGERWGVLAQWRILTVHHLNGVKWDCRWWNLAALCQRCHLTIQGKVLMERVYPFEHSEWFKPHAAGWYAATYLGVELTRQETLDRLDELLALEQLA